MKAFDRCSEHFLQCIAIFWAVISVLSLLPFVLYYLYEFVKDLYHLNYAELGVILYIIVALAIAIWITLNSIDNLWIREVYYGSNHTRSN